VFHVAELKSRVPLCLSPDYLKLTVEYGCNCFILLSQLIYIVIVRWTLVREKIELDILVLASSYLWGLL